MISAVLDESLACDFELDNHFDPGAEYVYAFRYSPEILAAKQEQLVRVLGEKGLEFVTTEHSEDGVRVDALDGRTMNDQDIALLYELSITNSALRHQGQLPGVSNFGEFFVAIGSDLEARYQELKSGYASDDRSDLMIGFHEHVTLTVPLVIRDIMLLELTAHVLTVQEKQALENLQTSLGFFEKIINPKNQPPIILGA